MRLTPRERKEALWALARETTTDEERRALNRLLDDDDAAARGAVRPDIAEDTDWVRITVG